MPLHHLFNHQSLEGRLTDALWKNDTVRVRKLLQECDADAVNTALLLAVRSMHKPSAITMVNLLLNLGADANARDESGKTVLMLANAFEAPGIISLLVQHGADINAQDNEGNTALMLSLQSHFWIAGNGQALLESNAAVNIQNKNGDTALSMAVRNSNQWGAVQPLLSHGADPYVANTVTGKNAYQYAIERSCAALVEFCRKNPAVAAKAKSGLTP